MNNKKYLDKNFIKIIICSLFIVHCALFTAQSASGDLAKVQSQIRAAEQQNKKIETEVKKSDANMEQTRRDLVKTAEHVDKLEIERAGLQNKIIELDARRKKLSEQIIQNQGRLADTAAALLAALLGDCIQFIDFYR